MDKEKPFSISKQEVWEAYRRVKANQGAAGIDGQSISDFEEDLKNNLYKIWNRMSSGCYFPPPVRRVEIPKGDGRTRPLGIPTVSDRVAQMVVKRYLETIVEPVFHSDSYGYRPGRSAHQALNVARQRCWRYDWVLDLDVKSFFEKIDHELLMRAVRKHTECAWVLLYIERWLKAPVCMPDGTLVKRDVGSPQGAVISPVLANLFLHYVFDRWMTERYPNIPFERYADDMVCHCRSEAEARLLQAALKARFAECQLDLHPEKTKIVYCRDDNRRGDYPWCQFNFLGYSFQPRRAMNRRGQLFVSFGPAISGEATKAMRQRIRRWKVHHRSDLALEEIAKWTRPVILGWVRYYGRFRPSALLVALRTLDHFVVRWARRKYKKLRAHIGRAWDWLERLKARQPDLFPHWGLGPTAGR